MPLMTRECDPSGEGIMVAEMPTRESKISEDLPGTESDRIRRRNAEWHDDIIAVKPELAP